MASTEDEASDKDADDDDDFVPLAKKTITGRAGHGEKDGQVQVFFVR